MNQRFPLFLVKLKTLPKDFQKSYLRSQNDGLSMTYNSRSEFDENSGNNCSEWQTIRKHLNEQALKTNKRLSFLKIHLRFHENSSCYFLPN